MPGKPGGGAGDTATVADIERASDVAGSPVAGHSGVRHVLLDPAGEDGRARADVHLSGADDVRNG